MTNFASSTADGKQRTIEIKSPADGSAVTGSLQLSGDVSVAPFENNLSYIVYDEASNQLAAGPVTITATTQGSPGTFSVPISLTGIPSGTTIYLEVRDLSAADGSLLAMDSVKLLTK
jgi:hypothetical protein